MVDIKNIIRWWSESPLSERDKIKSSVYPTTDRMPRLHRAMYKQWQKNIHHHFVLSLPTRETHDGREKHCFFIWLHTKYFIYLTEDVKSQKRRVEKGGKYSFQENDSWARGCATHESTMYCGCLWGCVQRGCVSIGNKSPSIPRMRTASQVSHS